MTSRERVIRTIRGEKTDRTPIYGWVSANLGDQIGAAYGSVAAFEDQYEFDAAHIFGIENQLMYLLMYPDEIAALYQRQADWLIGFADCCIGMGVDCVHISDDWGSQRDMLFSPALWSELIKPNLRRVVDHVHERGCLVSLHSDGCIAKVTDELAELGFDMLHPWQESAGMSYERYLERYADRFALLGGICVQTAIGILPQDRLEAEIRRVFGILKGKRWICCTSHYVQSHCSMDDLKFAFDLIYRLAREPM